MKQAMTEKTKIPGESRAINLMVRKRKPGPCALCGEIRKLTGHHLTPEGLGGTAKGSILVCVSCHEELHSRWTLTELSQSYNTLDALRSAMMHPH